MYRGINKVAVGVNCKELKGTDGGQVLPLHLHRASVPTDAVHSIDKLAQRNWKHLWLGKTRLGSNGWLSANRYVLEAILSVDKDRDGWAMMPGAFKQ
jgi:hypothetical protein